jgi:putative PIN family toxin of toxin-antitoxin system
MSTRPPYQIVIDTNVLVAGLRSTQGASYKLLTVLKSPKWELNVSTGLILEYEAVLKRPQTGTFLSFAGVDRVIDDICSLANHHSIFYMWRPIARDPDDDFLVDLAVKAQANFIITYNLKDLRLATQFGIRVVEPKLFLEIVGEL